MQQVAAAFRTRVCVYTPFTPCLVNPVLAASGVFLVQKLDYLSNEYTATPLHVHASIHTHTPFQKYHIHQKEFQVKTKMLTRLKKTPHHS